MEILKEWKLEKDEEEVEEEEKEGGVWLESR